jgi:hypothetical protein
VWTPEELRGNPVHNRRFSPLGVPRTKPATMRLHAVFPVLHTPYYYYERI